MGKLGGLLFVVVFVLPCVCSSDSVRGQARKPDQPVGDAPSIPKTGEEGGGVISKPANITRSARVMVNATKPLSTAMQCTLILLAVFFITQTLILAANESRSSMGAAGGGNDEENQNLMGRQASQVTGCFAAFLTPTKIAKVNDTLRFVPMLCIIMMFARMRANDMGLNPQSWGQAAMWCSTIAILVQLAVVLAFPSADGTSRSASSQDDEGLPHGGHGNINKGETVEEDNNGSFVDLIGRIVRFTAVTGLYGGVIVVIVSIVTLKKMKEQQIV